MHKNKIAATYKQIEAQREREREKFMKCCISICIWVVSNQRDSMSHWPAACCVLILLFM